MTSLLIDDIGLLVTGDAPPRPSAAVVLAEGQVAWVGSASAAPAADRRLSAEGGCVVPGFVDCHTHLVFGGDRSAEFEARLAGAPYTAGGILSTVAATRATSTEALAGTAGRLAAEALRTGSTTVEVKSGYGLTVADEVRCLQVAGGLSPHPTFLGAHAVPAEFAGDPDGYTQLVAGPMLRACAGLATAVDVFCETGAFDGDQSRVVLEAGQAAGLDLHVHANQLGPGPGARLAAELGAASADHCTYVDAADIEALRDAGVVAVLVPAAEFGTGSRYAPARSLLDAGVTVALATDCNPGTSFTTSMPFVIALACRELGLTPWEAVQAATAGGAAALRRHDIGRIAVGCRGDLVVLAAPSPVYLAYRPGVDLVAHVVQSGEVVR